MTKLDRAAFDERIRELFGFTPEQWAAIGALAKAEKRLRDLDQARMQAHLERTIAGLPDRLRAEGYDIPDGLRFEITP